MRCQELICAQVVVYTLQDGCHSLVGKHATRNEQLYHGNENKRLENDALDLNELKRPGK